MGNGEDHGLHYMECSGHMCDSDACPRRRYRIIISPEVIVFFELEVERRAGDRYRSSNVEVEKLVSTLREHEGTVGSI